MNARRPQMPRYNPPSKSKASRQDTPRWQGQTPAPGSPFRPRALGGEVTIGGKGAVQTSDAGTRLARSSKR